VVRAAGILKTRLRGYDLPCRVRETEFAAILRQANALEVHQRALLITTDLRAAARRIRPLTKLPIEFTSAVYPYDAENITGLFAYANKHWPRLWAVV
jgi:GGDEF domain-containing protein